MYNKHNSIWDCFMYKSTTVIGIITCIISTIGIGIVSNTISTTVFGIVHV